MSESPASVPTTAPTSEPTTAPAAAPASDPASNGFIDSAWRDQAVWSEAAGRLKSALGTWRVIAAVAGGLGALLTTLAGTLAHFGAQLGNDGNHYRVAVAGAGTLLLALVPYVLKARVSTEQVRAWIRARAAAEALKETIYRYLVGAAPYAPTPTPADLVRRCQAIKQGLSDLGALAATVEPKPKSRPSTLTVDEYAEQRVAGQVNGYYYPSARKNALKARRLRGLEFSLSLLATLLAAVAGLSEAVGAEWLGEFGAWAAVATTIAGAITAHIAASRFDHQATVYFSTAERLRGLRDEWLASPDRLLPDNALAFVDNCERAISAENEAWLAEWSANKTEG